MVDLPPSTLLRCGQAAIHYCGRSEVGSGAFAPGAGEHPVKAPFAADTRPDSVFSFDLSPF